MINEQLQTLSAELDTKSNSAMIHLPLRLEQWNDAIRAAEKKTPIERDSAGDPLELYLTVSSTTWDGARGGADRRIGLSIGLVYPSCQSVPDRICEDKEIVLMLPVRTAGQLCRALQLAIANLNEGLEPQKRFQLHPIEGTDGE